MTDDQQLIAEAREFAAVKIALGGMTTFRRAEVDRVSRLADALSAAAVRYRAEGWDEGYEAGVDDEAFSARGLSTDADADKHPHRNPHRALLDENNETQEN